MPIAEYSRVRESGRLASEVGRHPHCAGGACRSEILTLYPDNHGRTFDGVWHGAMQAASPHFLLFTEASAAAGANPGWRFVLQPIGGDTFFAADDVEPGTSNNRLELLAVVRGLEALDKPSRVTLLTASRYVNRGIRRGLSQWRDRKWRWERFGQLVPIRNQDLWQRVDRAMQLHQLECCPAQLAQESREVARGEEVGLASNLPAAEAASPEAALLVVPRRHSERTVLDAGQPGRFLSTLNRLRQGVLAPLAAIWRPAFTRAA